MTMEPTINRQYKDRVFRFYFGYSKENCLSLYNALNGSNYTDPEQLIFNSLDNVIYMGMKNDLAFRLYLDENFYEHQSSWNPNAPLRGLFYIAKDLEGYVSSQPLSIYSSRLIKIPTPHYVIFYNGIDKDIPDHMELRLSDAFEKPGGCLELTAQVYNINIGHNEELMRRCKPLHDYAQLVHLIRRNQDKGMELNQAVDEAVTECIRSGIMADFLRKHRSEVVGMILTEYNEEETLNKLRADEREQGGILNLAYAIKEGFSITKAANIMKMSVSQFKQRAKELGCAL